MPSTDYIKDSTSSYSNKKAILADFQAYIDDYPSIYFIYYKNIKPHLFLSNYDLNRKQALNILKRCHSITKTGQKLVCIQEQDNNFNVIFKPNFSNEVIDQFNRGNYKIEIYLENEKIYSNLSPNVKYTLKITDDFNGEKKWKITAFFTTGTYEKLQRFFPTVFFIFGSLVSFLTLFFFYLLNINSRKNNILNINEQKLKKLNSIDSLINSLNRHTLMLELNNMLKSNRASDSKFTVLFIDLDNFKYVNDTYGHDVGDTILKKTTSMLKTNLRDKDIIARIGGDEFVAILKNLKDKETLTKILDRTIKSFEEKIYIHDKLSIKQSISIGISIYTQDNQSSAEELIKQADDAMYVAKNKGKNQYCFF